MQKSATVRCGSTRETVALDAIKCDANGYVVCQPCNGSGTIQCKRCEGDGRLIEFDFFAICNSGDLSQVNFPKPKFGAVEKMAQERLFHLGKISVPKLETFLEGE